jgi:hypothetical protein
MAYKLSDWGNHSFQPYNLSPYPGDTDGDIAKESMELENLEKCKTYYALICVVGQNGTESKPSNEISFTPKAVGTFVISRNHSAQNGGFSFDHGMTLPARDPRSDLYFYATQSKMGLSSPNRLEAGLRQTKFSGKASEKHKTSSIPIKKGDEITVETIYGKAEISIDSILGEFPDISAKIRYEYCP